VRMKCTTTGTELGRFPSLILSVPRMITSVPTQPTEDVTIVMMLSERMAWASSTPDIPIRYSPTVNPTTVCLTTSAALRLNRVMSGVITAPTMKPPATSVVPSRSEMAGPAGSDVTSVPKSRATSPLPIDHATSTRNDGTVSEATHFIEAKPHSTLNVTARRNSGDHTQSGSTPIRLTRPSADTADWMPNQPISEIPIATPTTALPPWPKPVQRASTEVGRPSRQPMMPTPIETSSRITAPNVKARNASQKPI